MSKLYAGAAKVCISPPQNILDEMIAAGSYTSFKGVDKDVYVRCLALTDGTEKFLVYSIEMGSFPAQRRFRARMQEKFGVHPDAVMLGNTHNHQMIGASDPDENPPGAGRPMDGKLGEINTWLIEFFHSRAEEAARIALEGAVPAKMGYTSGSSYINASRDWPTPVGGLQNSDYGGYSDRELVVMKVVTEDNQPIASVVNFGVHSNMLYGYRFSGEFALINGDIGGEIMEFVENAHAQKEVCLWVEAAAGDQNPLFTGFMAGVKANPDGTFERTNGNLHYTATIQIMEHLAQVQGLEILKAEKNIQTYSNAFELKHGRTTVSVPGVVNARTQFNLAFAGGQEGTGRVRREVMPEEFFAMERTPTEPVKFKFHLAVLNGMAFCGVNTEPYSYLGRIVKDVLPYPKAMIFAIDAGHVGYMPDVRKGEVAGFGTLDCHAESFWDTERAFYEGFRDLAKELDK